MRIIFLLMISLLVSCAHQSIPRSAAMNTAYQGVYSNLEFNNSARLQIEAKRPPISQSQYIHAWRGSYRDSRGNLVEDGWEWVRIKDEAPDANF